MNLDYMLACGIVWRKTADPIAGLELLEALKAHDPGMRALAQALLVEGGDASMRLLEDALADGTVSSQAAGGCIAEIWRDRQNEQSKARPGGPLSSDLWLC